MVWSKISKADNKPRYVIRYGNFYVLSKEPKGAVESIPNGWEVKYLPSGHLKLSKSRS